MKSNDALLCLMIAAHEKQSNKQAGLVIDQRLFNPSIIKIKANEVVYLHFFQANHDEFNIEINTALQTLELEPQNCVYNSSNTILRALSDITFKNSRNTDFYVQILRIQY